MKIPRKQLEHIILKQIEEKQDEYDIFLAPRTINLIVDKLIEYDKSLGLEVEDLK